eukprot:gene3697-4396_t
MEWRVAALVAVDIGAVTTSMLGIALVGSGLGGERTARRRAARPRFEGTGAGRTCAGCVSLSLYVALYASITVFTAVGRCALLRRPLNAPQWAGVLLITTGVGITIGAVHGDAATDLVPGVTASLASA